MPSVGACVDKGIGASVGGNVVAATGAMDGDAVGSLVLFTGACEGNLVGEAVGAFVGWNVGKSVAGTGA